MHLTYSQLEDALMVLHSIEAGQRTAFRGRIKHFQRNGWPGGTNTGKGRAATYDIAALLRLAIGFELLQLGVTPERTVTLLRSNWDYVSTALSLAFYSTETEVRTPFDVILYCDPMSLSYLQQQRDEADPSDETFFYNSTIQLSRQLRANPHLLRRRLSMINLSALLTDIAQIVGGWEPLHTAYQRWDEAERRDESPADEIGSLAASAEAIRLATGTRPKE